jgi:hypothetical protein
VKAIAEQRGWRLEKRQDQRTRGWRNWVVRETGTEREGVSEKSEPD